MKWWWVSFADEVGFLGACVVQAGGGPADAMEEVKRLRLAPTPRGADGEGEAAVVLITEEQAIEEYKPHANKLLSAGDIFILGWDPVTMSGEPAFRNRSRTIN